MTFCFLPFCVQHFILLSLYWTFFILLFIRPFYFRSSGLRPNRTFPNSNFCLLKVFVVNAVVVVVARRLLGMHLNVSLLLLMLLLLLLLLCAVDPRIIDELTRLLLFLFPVVEQKQGDIKRFAILFRTQNFRSKFS